MYSVGRLLQIVGLVVVPMALFYYWGNREERSEAVLMFGELSILVVGAGLFLFGQFLVNRRTGQSNSRQDS